MIGMELSAKALAELSGVNRQCITNVRRGWAWPDVLTVINLEQALGTMLWPVDDPEYRAELVARRTASRELRSATG